MCSSDLAYQAGRTELAERGRVLPGARQALEALAKDPAVHQTVLTGNLRGVAHVKLAAFGLAQYVDLDAGAFGDDHNVRAELVKIAQQRAAERTGGSFGDADTVLIGDTPRDVEAALAAGVRVIAVASGRSTKADLRAAGAGRLLDDLSDVQRLRELLDAD